MDLPGQTDLQHRIRRACLEEDARALVFVIGSGASLGAVPGTSEMVDYFERSIAADAEDLSDFREKVRHLDGALEYQAAARFLIERAGLTHLNKVVRSAVMRARTPRLPAETARTYVADEARLKDLENDYAGWAVPQGIAAIARVLARVPVEVRGPIITTNFDPLLEAALQSCGMTPHSIFAEDDGAFSYAESPSSVVPVVHLHGYWRIGDTLHTAAQLERARPRLLGSLRQILTNSTCVVLGYGGWDDILTSSILDLVGEGNQRLLEVLWASHGSTPALGSLDGAALPGRIQPYVNVDINTLMPAVDSALSDRSLAPQAGALLRRSQSSIGGCTLIDAEFRRLQLERSESLQRILSYFDGREPSWPDILSGRAAVLQRTQDLVDEALIRSTDLPGYLLEGPTGEGKSTLLRQLAAELSSRIDYQVWWANPGGRIDVDALLDLSITSAKKCLLVDDADLHVNELTSLLTRLKADSRDDIRVFMASRDTDWRRSVSRRPGMAGHYHSKIVKGISATDATSIVDCWAKWGPRGLGRLADLAHTTEARAQFLYEESIGPTDSDLLGALLTTRYGNEFDEHIRQLLTRLERVALPGSKTLLDAYLIICVVHELGMGSTAIDHLSRTIGLSPQETTALVANRLGFEAAAQRHGSYIAPRHPQIATAVVHLSSEFGRRTADVIKSFVCAVTAAAVGSRWGQEILEIVFSGQRIADEDCARAAIDGAVAGDPSQLRLRSAQIGVYRRQGKLAEATELCELAWDDFDNLSDVRLAMRGYFREWSRVVGSLGHWEASAALNACALLDLPEADENDRNNVGRALSGIAFSLGQIASDPMEERFLFVGVCAEEAIQSAADSETRAQAERTLGRAVVHGYATVKSPVERRRLVRDAIKYSLSLSTVGPAKKLRVRSRELTDVFTVLAI